MLDRFELFFVGELDYLRLEAMDLFERCLTEGSPNLLMDYIEAQIVCEPPRLDLLHKISEDLHLRLLALREFHFDMRDRVLRTLRDDFHADLSGAAPPQALETYHLLDLDSLMNVVVFQNPCLTAPEQTVLRKTLETSVEMATQLRSDVVMTEHLFVCLTDWIDALTTTEARRCWGNNLGQQVPDPIQ
jgi:hypothetical protein